jgi:UDP-N-acetyl-2-amino-2-deoxyglucuronate dehydrogenase
MSNEKFKIALVGCGRISAKHFEAIYENREHLELVAICDTDKEAALQTKIDVPYYQSI